MKKNQTYSRRDFLKTAGVASVGLGTLLTKQVAGNQTAQISSNDMVGIGIIGTGSRGNHLLQILTTIPGVKITALCDIYEPNLNRGLKLAGGNVPTYKDYRELLERKDVDGVVIATPLYLHAEMSIAAMRAKKDVLCEKTMTYSVEECRAVTRCVQETGQVFQVGLQRRYSPLYQKVVKMIHDGAIGKVTCIRAQWHRNADWRRPIPDPSLEKLINWRMYREFSGGLMAELGCHQLHVANWVLQEVPISAVGIGGIDYYKDGREVYDNVNVIYAYPSGAKFIYTSITTNKFYGCSEQIMGTEGTIEITTSRAKLYREKDIRRTEFENFVMDLERQIFETVALGTATFLPEDPNKDKGKPIAAEGMTFSETYYELEHFVRCMRTREPVLCDVIEGGNAAIATHMGNRAMDLQEVVLWPKGDTLA